MLMSGVVYKHFSDGENSTSETEADAYYKANSDVIRVIDVDKSKDVLTESEASLLFRERGFEDQPMAAAYSMDGGFLDEYEISEDSSKKHPMYETLYITKKGEMWNILIVDGIIMAYPISYNLESGSETELLISESKELTSYDNETNKFYVTVPKKSACIVKVVDSVNKETLDKFTVEVLKKS